MKRIDIIQKYSLEYGIKVKVSNKKTTGKSPEHGKINQHTSKLSLGQKENKGTF